MKVKNQSRKRENKKQGRKEGTERERKPNGVDKGKKIEIGTERGRGEREGERVKGGKATSQLRAETSREK